MDYKALAGWLSSRKTGASSVCIARHLMGGETDGSYPHDAGDFDRCEGLLDAVPGLRKRLPEMAAVNRYWAALVPRWEEIRTAQDKTAMIRSIVRPLEDAYQKVVRLGDRITLRFGEIE